MNKKQTPLFGLCSLIVFSCSTPVRTSVRYVGEERHTPRIEQCDVRVTGVSPERTSEVAILSAIGPRCSLNVPCGGLEELLPELKRKT